MLKSILYKKTYKKQVKKVEEPKDYFAIDIDREAIKNNALSLAIVYLPKVLFIISVSVITYTLVLPEIYKMTSTPEVQGDHIEVAVPANYTASPETGYFNKLLAVQKDNSPEIDTESKNYNGTFELKIPSINIAAKVKANVSPVESEYKRVLDTERMLAHYQGNAIPGKPGNVFIYGHSTYKYLFRENSENPATEFTKLFDLKLGSKIEIIREGISYKYTVTKTFQVDPTRLDILNQENNDEKLLTLMTCGAPPGDSAQRYVVIAKQDE